MESDRSNSSSSLKDSPFSSSGASLAELPGDEGALWEALEAGYYPFSPQRRREGEYLDDFGQPYRFRSQPGRALIYSVGPNGKDDGGEGDDVRDQWVTFVR